MSPFGRKRKLDEAHLSLLNWFTTPRRVDKLSRDWQSWWRANLRKSPDKAIKRFQKQGLIAFASLAQALSTSITAEIRKQLKARRLKTGGDKAQMIARLVAADPNGVALLCRRWGVYICTDVGAGMVLHDEDFTVWRAHRLAEEQGPASPVCPHCGLTFDFDPIRKRKCPECRETIVPAKQYDQIYKRFVTEQEAEQIEQANEEHYTRKRIRALEQQLARAIREGARGWELQLRAELARERGLRDEAWKLLNQAAMEAASRLQGGFYRNIRMTQGEFMANQEHWQPALGHFCEVAYLDYCRVTNIVTGGQGRPIDQMPFFAQFVSKRYGLNLNGPDRDFPPGLLTMILDAVEGAGIDLGSLRSIFMERAEIAHSSLEAPFSPKGCWSALRKALANRVSG